MYDKDNYIKVIDVTLEKLRGGLTPASINEGFYKTLTLVQNLYGENNIRVTTLVNFKEERIDPHITNGVFLEVFQNHLEGILISAKTDIESGLLTNIEKYTIGSVVADFISLAKESIDNQNKDVAAVLASAALEDALKRYAGLNGLKVDEKDMSEVVNALKSLGLVGGPQGALLSSYVKFRNKAFHAEWDKIEIPDVKSIISFTEQFILEKLGLK